MSSKIDAVCDAVRAQPRVWLVTGAAGFIGSNLVERLLGLGQTVVALDNFATGFQANLDSVKGAVTASQWRNFNLIEGDIRDAETCKVAVAGCNMVLHQAGLGSVPRSLADPVTTNAVNISGFLNMLTAARDAQVESFVYAASSSTYGDHPALPKREDVIGAPLSPYAVTKYVNELYASVFARAYGFRSIGLRYFNIFGPRQNPNGAYAAVIPLWILSMLRNEPVWINGDGTNSRDFTFVENAVQANILAAMAPDNARDQIYNVACGDQLSLLDVFDVLTESLAKAGMPYAMDPQRREPRAGDVRHSKADITKAQQLLGYAPTHDFRAGVAATTPAYIAQLAAVGRAA